jgi:hypothetical protein
LCSIYEIAEYQNGKEGPPPSASAGYTGVLVRLSRVNPDMIRDLLGMAYGL